LIGSRYRLERTLGEGGMAAVHLAHDLELDRPVAVKILNPALAADEAFRERFLREARNAARLAHPNVVHVFDAGTDDDGVPYIVMEYVEGGTLAERGKLEPGEAIALVLQAAAGLAHAHAAGLVHRDVTPGNLLVRSDGTLKVADFGIARAAEEGRLTQTGTILGTAAYLSPEQAAGKEATPAADVYALGAVVYELLTGRTPHVFASLVELVRMQQEEPIVPVRELAPDVSPEVEDAVMHALAREPAYRPQDGAALAAELAAATSGAATVPLVPPAPPLRRRRRRLWGALAGTIVLLGIAAALVAVEVGGRSSPTPPPVLHVTPVPHAPTAAGEARNLAAWLRAHSK
jgi:serine/threonine-protein kinase